MSTEFSGKKDCFVQIGATRRRITGEHHSLLCEHHSLNPYLSMEDLVFQTSLEWLRFAHSSGIMSLINARPRIVR